MKKNEQPTPIEELVSILLSFTPEQMQAFLEDPITASILRPAEAGVPDLQAVS